MKRAPRVGESGERRFQVAAEHTISFAPGKLPPVLSTPALLWQLEHAALDVLLPLQDDDEISVGTEVQLEHLAPARVGTEVTCTARIIHVDRGKLAFQIEAQDARAVLARGTHRRRVVEVTRLAKSIGS